MIAVLRTIVYVDIAFNGLVLGMGALVGLTPMQSIGAGVIGFAAIFLVLGWRALVNATPGYRPSPEQEWMHRNDPVAPPLALPQPAPRLLEAPGRELERIP